MQRLPRAPRWLSSGAEHVPRYDDRYETAKWRTLWLMVGFLVLVGVGIVTVLRPELEDEPNEDGRSGNHRNRGERRVGTRVGQGRALAGMKRGRADYV